jgi:hypothetical protein
MTIRDSMSANLIQQELILISSTAAQVVGEIQEEEYFSLYYGYFTPYRSK